MFAKIKFKLKEGMVRMYGYHSHVYENMHAFEFSFLIFLWYATTFGGFFRGFLDCDVEGA